MGISVLHGAVLRNDIQYGMAEQKVNFMVWWQKYKMQLNSLLLAWHGMVQLKQNGMMLHFVEYFMYFIDLYCTSQSKGM